MTRTNFLSMPRCLAMVSTFAVVLAGCAAPKAPQPWEKGNLAKPEMMMTSNPLEQRYQQHIYTSKEAASGGHGIGGGGCGCN